MTTATGHAAPPPAGPPPEPGPVSWTGLLIPFDRATIDGRVVAAPPGDVHTRPMPMPLLWYDDERGQLPAGTIERVRNHVMADGRRAVSGVGVLDPAQPGYAGLVDQAWRAHQRGEQLGIGVDLDQMTAGEQEQDEDRPPVMLVTDFLLIGATVVTDPAWPDARLVLNWP